MKRTETLLRTFGLTLVVTWVFAAVVVPAGAQSQIDVETVNSNGDLRITVNKLNTNVACGSPIELRLELTNMGAETIRIDNAELWFRYSHHLSEPKPDGYVGEGFGSTRSELAPGRGTYLEIPPGLSYTETHSLQLRDVFFKNHASIHCRLRWNSWIPIPVRTKQSPTKLNLSYSVAVESRK